MAAARRDEPLGSLEIDGVVERRGKSSDGDDCYLVGEFYDPHCAARLPPLLLSAQYSSTVVLLRV